jgi:hypothetical protein
LGRCCDRVGSFQPTGRGFQDRAAIEEAIEDETVDDENGKRRTMMLRAVALPSRAGIIVNLSSALRTLVALERQAFNLGDVDGNDRAAAALRVQVRRAVSSVHPAMVKPQQMSQLSHAHS